jgi:serine/threonine protein kinase
MSLPKIAGLELQELIGSGSCGAVYRAVSSATREECAVKVFSSMSINRKLLSIVLSGLQSMPEHPGLLRPVKFNFDQSPYFCAMPLVGSMTTDESGRTVWHTPTLETCCGKVAAGEAWRYLYEVCDAMAWLHKHNLVHCNLKPHNVLLENSEASATRITDPLQGWVQGIHHFEVTDHFMYVPPEQVEHPDQLSVNGSRWDVYAFGVLAYRLLTGKFPRAGEVYEAETQKVKASKGMKVLDGQVIMAAVKAQKTVEWPAEPVDKWDARRREIIHGCLMLEMNDRWADLREVMREFEKLEADFLLEDAREKIEIEKVRQARKVWLLRSAAMVLGVAFVVAVVYGAVYGFRVLNRAKQAESTIVENAADHLVELTALESTNIDLSQAKQQAEEAKRVADANLQMSQVAVDNLLTQILELPTGLGLDSGLSEKPIADVLAFYEKERENFRDNEALLPERARNYFNSAQLLMRQQKRAEALGFFQQAREVLLVLLEKEPAHVDVPRRQALLGKTCRWLGSFRADDGLRTEALTMFRESVKYLEPALAADPQNRATREEAATAFYELGKRLRRNGDTAAAVAALDKVPLILAQEQVPDDELSAVEQFLVARSQIEQALALRDKNEIDEAMKVLFEAMEVMVKLVEKAAPNNKEQALTLAEAYVEFGGVISGKLGSSDAKEAQTEAQAILMELLRVHPQWAEARYLLAKSYGEVAGIERDEGHGPEALRKQTTAVQTLAELSKDNPENTRFLTELARQRGQHAQLLCDLGKPKDGVSLASEAVTSLEGMLGERESALDELDRKTCGVLLAQLYGILGHAGETAKDKVLARSSYGKASAQWQSLEAKHGKDEVIDQGLEWTAARLKSLK